MQLRALDWDTDGGLQDYPVVTIYHPGTSKLGHPFANIAWAGKSAGIFSLLTYNNSLCIHRLYWSINWYVFSKYGYF